MKMPVAAAICYQRKNNSIEFLLIRTKNGKQWTFPKGHVEPKPLELLWQAAQREADEEAGAIGEIEKEPFTHYTYFKGKSSQEETIAAHLMLVKSEHDPKEPERKPKWFSPEEAMKKLAKNREKKYVNEHQRVILEALARLS